ncbi:MAG TPA: hypothetical protein VG247_15850 [Pseudonocardiaceae bacterium]|nr:hypothetical protein [Pseudonocardiaceae bacterium]
MNGDAARRYKEIAGLNTEAVERMREADRALVDRLAAQVLSAENALAQVSERERVARVGVELAWERAMEDLWGETWLKVEPMPEPARPTAMTAPRDADAEVGRTLEALQEALRKQSRLPRLGRREAAEPED